MAREGNRANRALGALSLLARNSPDSAAVLLEANRKEMGGVVTYGSLEVIALCRAGRLADAETLLTSSWQRPELSSSILVAEAELRKGQGDSAGEARAWRAYVKRTSMELGPMAVAAVQQRLQMLSMETSLFLPPTVS